MHKYTCTECPTQPFFTQFAPIFDEPAYCPCCGQQTTTEYKGEVNQDDIKIKFNGINELMRKLYDIKKGTVKYGLSDLSDWLAHDLEKVCVMLDELQADVEEVKV